MPLLKVTLATLCIYKFLYYGESGRTKNKMGEKVCIFAHLYFFLYLCPRRSALSLPTFGSGEESPGNTEHHAG